MSLYLFCCGIEGLNFIILCDNSLISKIKPQKLKKERKLFHFILFLFKFFQILAKRIE
jgi:hypothetical protein